MNNKPFIFAVGGVIGFLAGWFVSKKYYEQTIMDKANTEIEEMRGYFEQKKKELEDRKESEVKEILDDTNRELKHEAEERLRNKPSLEELQKRYLPKKPIDYTNIPGPGDSDEYDGEEEDMDNYIPPKLVSLDSYGEESSWNEEELLYYQENDVLINENEEVIEDPGRLIGTALTKYCFNENDESDIYVENENLRTYYHVHKMFDSWEG